MDKKQKGLADRGDGDFILNESGTSVNVDNVENMPKERSDNLDKSDNYTSGDKGSSEPYMPRTADEQKDITD